MPQPKPRCWFSARDRSSRSGRVELEEIAVGGRHTTIAVSPRPNIVPYLRCAKRCALRNNLSPYRTIEPSSAAFPHPLKETELLDKPVHILFVHPTPISVPPRLPTPKQTAQLQSQPSTLTTSFMSSAPLRLTPLDRVCPHCYTCLARVSLPHVQLLDARRPNDPCLLSHLPYHHRTPSPRRAPQCPMTYGPSA